MKNTLIFIVAIVLAGTGGYALQKQLKPKQVSNNPALGIQRPEFSAMDLSGNIRNINEWDGDLILLNFWATWCPPCKKEIPAFIELQQAYGDQGFQVIGIAIDNEESVRQFAETVGINYPVMAAETQAVMLSKRYGNGVGALPYSVIINRKGEISNIITGELSKIQAKELLDYHDIKL